MIERFCENLRALLGEPHVVGSLDEARGRARSLTRDATVARWADASLDGIATAEAPPEEAEMSLIVADVAIAETGAIGFVHGPGRPRAAALLPDRQIALVSRSDLVETVEAMLARFQPPPPSLVLAAGPSRTADIEQRVIMGVHAPRTLDVIVYGAGS